MFVGTVLLVSPAGRHFTAINKSKEPVSLSLRTYLYPFPTIRTYDQPNERTVLKAWSGCSSETRPCLLALWRRKGVVR